MEGESKRDVVRKFKKLTVWHPSDERFKHMALTFRLHQHLGVQYDETTTETRS
jgi:hypothetical protein